MAITPKKSLSSNCEKRIKTSLGIIWESFAYLLTMPRTSVLFHKNWHEIVGGVAHTRYLPRSIIVGTVKEIKSATMNIFRNFLFSV